MDEVVVFRSLGQPQVRRIADLELAKTAARMAQRGIGLEVSSALMAAIVEQGWNEAMGARELRRAVTRLVDDALSDAVLRDEVRPAFGGGARREAGWRGGGLPDKCLPSRGAAWCSHDSKAESLPRYNAAGRVAHRLPPFPPHTT